MFSQDLDSIIQRMLVTLRTHYNKGNAGDVDALLTQSINTSRENQRRNLFERLVLSIHNANWNATSQETFWADRRKYYEAAFNGFNHNYVKDLTVSQLSDPRHRLINSRNKIEACLSAARFLHDLEQSNGDPISFFNKFAYEGSTVYERWALVGMLSQSIKGIGTALACDFLKEIGYTNIGKPDVHVKRIMCRIGLWKMFKDEMISGDDNFICFRILDKLARASGKTVFEVDKIFWLYGSGFSTQKSIKGICTHNPADCFCHVCELGNRGICAKDFNGCN